MQPPLDYAIDTDEALPDNAAGGITYAALLDRFEAEKPITDEMIQQACQKMEAAQQFPFTTDQQKPVQTFKRLLRSVI